MTTATPRLTPHQSINTSLTHSTRLLIHSHFLLSHFSVLLTDSTRRQTVKLLPGLSFHSSFPFHSLYTMSLVKQFLSQIHQQVRNQQGDLLRSWLQVEPESPKQYHDLAAELRARFNRQDAIDKVVEDALPQLDDLPEGQATSWPGLLAFLKDYLTYWGDVDFTDLLGAHQLLSGLVK